MDGVWDDSVLFRGKGNSSGGGMGRILVTPASSEGGESFMVREWEVTSLAVTQCVDFQGEKMIWSISRLVEGRMSRLWSESY